MKLVIDRLHVDSNPKLTAYINEKLGKLDHLLPRHARKSAHAEVKIIAGPGRGSRQINCEVIVHLPREIITVSQSATSAEAAVDLAEAKLKNRFKRYKDKHTFGRRRLINRLRLR